MAALVQALDNFTPICAGENGHTELAWSNDIQEKIVQFDFQCVRTDSSGLDVLSLVLQDLLSILSAKRTNDDSESNRKRLLVLLFKIIGKTRDIGWGKGEYAISYMMIWTWYKYFPVMAEFALSLFVFDQSSVRLLNKQTLGIVSRIEEFVTVPYGSWKDMKYFCDYVRKMCGSNNHRLIDVCVDYTNFQLRADDLAYGKVNEENLSLVAKWIPREKSKFGWLHKKLALSYFPEYMRTATEEVNGKSKAEKKCLTQYRMLYAKLNRHLDTVQIKQTSNNWASIDHSKTTSITMAKQRKAFLNQTRFGFEQRTEDPDRIQCAENLKTYRVSRNKEVDFETLEEDNSNINLCPFEMLVQTLDNERYKPMEYILCQYLA